MRAALRERRAQQVKNQGTNPSFEKCSFATTGERFRNLCSDPRGTSYTSSVGVLRFTSSRWFGGAPAAGTYSLVTGASDGPLTDVTTYARKTWTVAPTAVANTGDTGFEIGGSNANGFPVQPNTTYTVSGYIRSSVIRSFTAGFYFYTAAGANASIARTSSATILGVIGEWSRVSYTYTPPRDAAFMKVVIDSQGSLPASQNYAVGSTVDCTAVMVTATSYLVPFFYGGINAAEVFGLDYSASWGGVADASQSIITGPTTYTSMFTNLSTNPALRTNLTGYVGAAGTGGAITLSRITDGTGPFGFNYARCVWDTAPSGGNPGIDHGTNIAVAAGEYVSITVRVRCSVASTVNSVIDWYTSGGAYISGSNGSKAIAANTWTEFTTSGLAPATTGMIKPHVRPTTAIPTGMSLEVTMVSITKTILPIEYFDGSFTLIAGRFADPDFITIWSGAADASSSSIVVVKPASSSGTNYTAHSFTKVGTGRKSLRVIPQGTAGNDTFAPVGGDTGGMRMGMEAGKTYTALSTLWLPAPLTGAVHATRTRNIQAYWRDSLGTYVSVMSAAIPNVAGTYQVRLSFTIPLGATEAFVRLYNGAGINGGDVWWDDFMLTEGVYTGPYLDGSSPNGKWLGSANESESVIYPKAA